MYQARPKQSLCDHVHECAHTMSTLLAPLGLPQLGALIGGMHDFGKMSHSFQEYIDFIEQNPLDKSRRGTVDHSTPGLNLSGSICPPSRKNFSYSDKSLPYALPPITIPP